jgi:uncharacterized protein YqjF (DUF2071 family)
MAFRPIVHAGAVARIADLHGIHTGSRKIVDLASDRAAEKKIADEAVRAAATEGARSVVTQQGGDMVASTPREFASFIEAERTRYEAIVRDAGMTVE